MLQQELLKKLVETLEVAGIPYMITGSLVSSLQGDPRLTHDIDVVVELTDAAAIAPLLMAFPPPRYYLDEISVRQAILRRDMFNLLDADTAYKVDFWLLKQEPFDQMRFANRIERRMGGIPVKVSRPEDTILMKLKWAQECEGSEKQTGDAKSIYEIQFAQLDQTYMDEWAARLGIMPLLVQLRRTAKPL